MRLIVGITGASGSVLGIELLRALQPQPCEVHSVVSRDGERMLVSETSYSTEDVARLSDRSYAVDDFTAPIASGSFKTDGMVIIPCSLKTVGGITGGYAENLLLRAADVCLKEGRKLVVVPREAPLGLVHLRNLTTLAEMGAVILPPVMTFYHHPDSIQDLIDYLIGKIFLQFGLEYPRLKVWGE